MEMGMMWEKNLGIEWEMGKLVWEWQRNGNLESMPAHL